ncbi:MAG: KUP/HAK/KT family potassium transporter [Bacteroidia bacterium]|nr:KUP/HAK/KT family potassium transporter [Bacteroidia bacterium]
MNQPQHKKGHHQFLTRFSFAGFLITLGIVFGDIGTSPLYVMRAIMGTNSISEQLLFGAISCVFWTLTFQTTIKYVLITLNADTKGEGGTFALYTLVRRKAKWLMIPAIIGGSALLADGIITPPISVTSAVEGLQIRWPEIPVVPIVIVIITGLFIFQQFGTKIVGVAFGPIMMLWFSMLGGFGLWELVQYPSILKSLNPYYAYDLLVNYPQGFWMLGAVFLCTTGAEALYSDLGHCGRANIRVSWIFVKITLLLNYLGQGAWLTGHLGQTIGDKNPFYYIIPEWFLLPGIIIATLATVIASQAMISGSFTLISEAIRLNFWPKIDLDYPTDMKGQLYVPSLNWILYAGCIGVVLFFQESSKMEAAYGLAITLTMMATTFLLTYFLKKHKVPTPIIILFFLVFISIETSFFVANIVKFAHGGWVTFLISSMLVFIMWVWWKARKVKNKFTEFEKFDKYLPMLSDLCEDKTVPKFATNLVYLTSADKKNEIETKIVYSIFNKQPKRADVYWFIHVHLTDEPYTMQYSVDILVPQKVVRVEFRLGFRIEPRINVYLRKVIEEMVERDEVNVMSRYDSLKKYNIMGDFRFVVIDRIFNYDVEQSAWEKFIMRFYFILKELGLSEEKAFGLDTSNVKVEKVPLTIPRPRNLSIKRVIEQPHHP